MGGSRGRAWARGVVVCSRTVGRVLRYGATSVVDFLVEDACILCRGGVETNGSLPPDPTLAAMLQPVRQRLAGIIDIVNHPLCHRCVLSLVMARGPGILGARVGPSTIVTPRGELFGGQPPVARVNAAAPGEDRSAAGNGPRMRVFAPFMTNDKILKIIHLLKFSGYRGLGRLVAGAMAASFPASATDVGGATLVPVPMRRPEINRRGYNQSADLAVHLSETLQITVNHGLLVKKSRTSRQSQLPTEKRADNVRHAFYCPERVPYDHVFLVDDLVTSGATAAACATALLESGAGSVSVISFARAL